MTASRRSKGQSNILEQRLKSDFKIFLRALWHELGLPAPTRAQNCIAEYLQYGPKRLQVQAFRGIGKSYVTAAYVLWELYRDHDKKIICLSASKDRADANSIFLQKLIMQIDWLAHMRPKGDQFRWSRVSFDIGGCVPTQSPSVKSVGITGNYTGSRADILLFDDCEVPNNSATDAQREKLLQLVSEAESVLIPKPTSRIIYLGTPQTTFTVYRRLAERGYRPYVWPSRYPSDPSLYEGTLAPELEADLEAGAKPGEPTDTRFSDEELSEREAHMGRSNYQLQFQLDTSLSDAEKFPLRFSDFICTPLSDTAAERYAWSSDLRYLHKELPAVGLPGDRWFAPMFIDPGMVEYAETILSVDPSGRGTDETVYTVLSQANGYVFVRFMGASRDGYSDTTLSEIVRTAKKYSASTILVESNFGDGMVCELLKRHLIQQHCNAHLEEVRASVRKEERIIETLEPILNQHKLIIDPKVIEWDYRSNPDVAPEKRLEYMLMYQLSRMCREKGAVKHDDRVDALSQGVQWFIDAMAISAHKRQAERANEEWQAMYDLFEEDSMAATDALCLGTPFKQMQKRLSRGSKPLSWN